MGLLDLDFHSAPDVRVMPAHPHGLSDSTAFGINGPAKRLIDIALTLPSLLFLLPIMLAIAIAVRLEGGPVLYKQIRIGRNGKRFGMLKFRTMHTDSDERLKEYLERNPAAKIEWDTFQKLQDDPRVTRIGHFLRRSSLDELPQLLNILKGDMSVVGQRPILPCQIDAYGVHIAGYERARPGLTGLWQISGRNTLTFEERAAMGSDYINRWSLWFDLKIIALTVPRILFSRDAF